MSEFIELSPTPQMKLIITTRTIQLPASPFHCLTPKSEAIPPLPCVTA